MSRIVGGPGALISILHCCRDLVKLEFRESILLIQNVTRSCKLEARLSLTEAPSMDFTCCVSVKDLMHALNSCESLAAPVFLIDYTESSSSLVLIAKEEEAIDFNCSVRTVDVDLAYLPWLGIGDELVSLRIDSEVLFTAFSQFADSSIDKVVVHVSAGLLLHAEAGPMTTDVTVPPTLCERQGSGESRFVISGKDVGTLMSFVSAPGDVKSIFRICRAGIRIERSSFVSASQLGFMEVVTGAVD